MKTSRANTNCHMKSAPCPTAQQLAAYLLDDESENAWIPDHIEECESCHVWVREMSDEIGLGGEVPLSPFASDTFASDTFASDTFASDTFASDTFASDTFASDTFASDTFASDGFASDGFASDGFASDGFASDAVPAHHLPMLPISNIEQDCSISVKESDPEGLQCCNQDRYREIRMHAKGGLGEVVLARDLELDRNVALKRIQPSRADDRSSRLRFIREAKITGKLEHPGIVPVYGRGNDSQGRPYFTMRFIDGDSLQAEIGQFHEKFGDVSWAIGEARIHLQGLLRRLVDVCNTIEYAHSQGVIHRDLKPRNVVLGRFGETIVVDWGLAKMVSDPGWKFGPKPDESGGRIADDDDATLFGEAVGTLGYMSPEQADGRLDSIDQRSDVYGLGAMLYRILTNRNSQDGDRERSEVLESIRESHFSKPREISRRVPGPLESICLKAMAKQPRHRYPCCRDMASDLVRFMANERVEAHRETGAERLFRQMRLRRITVAVLTAALFSAFSVKLAMQSWSLDSGQQLQIREFGRVDEELKKQREELQRARDALEIAGPISEH